MRKSDVRYLMALVGVWVVGCGSVSGLFSPQFVNTVAGGNFALTPGPSADFVLVRVRNETRETAEFSVAVERRMIRRNDDGTFQFDDLGNPITFLEIENVRLTTFATEPANELGILVDCSIFPVERVGLGEDLEPGAAAVFIGGGGPAGSPGFGISSDLINPLSLAAGNFNCGDTIIFRAFEQVGAAGNVGLQVLLLPGSEQPAEVLGPSTFENFQLLLESQTRESDP